MRIACMELHRGIFEPKFFQDFNVCLGKIRQIRFCSQRADFDIPNHKKHQKVDKIYFQKRHRLIHKRYRFPIQFFEISEI